MDTPNDGALGPLAETAWLAENLEAPGLRVLDVSCTLHHLPDDSDLWAESGHADWFAAHIPGAAHADLIGDLSDPDSPLRFTIPAAERFAAAMGRLGVGDASRVVLYDRNGGARATRLWWMLRAFGFDRAAVLDGGWKKWMLEGRPTRGGLETVAEASFTARPRPGIFVSKEAVLAARDGGTPLINALSERQHRGEGGAHYGRRGRIAGSVCVPAKALIDPKDGSFRSMQELRGAFAGTGALEAGAALTYCGGGIAATLDSLALHMLGVERIAIYDASMQEWAKHPDLPMETGPAMKTGPGTR